MNIFKKKHVIAASTIPQIQQVRRYLKANNIEHHGILEIMTDGSETWKLIVTCRRGQWKKVAAYLSKYTKCTIS